MTAVSLANSPVQVSLDYQFVAPPGVYWLGDPALMFPGEPLPPVNPAKRSWPTRVLADGTQLVVFRGQSATPSRFADSDGRRLEAPSGQVALAVAPEGRHTPDSVKLLALFEPEDVAVSGGVFAVGEQVRLTIGEPGEPFGGLWFADKYPHNPKPETLAGAHLDVRAVMSTVLPPGTYWVGDLRPNFDDELWAEASAATSGFASVAADVGGDGVVIIPAGRVCGAPTASDGNIFPHRGHIGVMRARRVPPSGGVHTYQFPQGADVRWRDGLIEFGGVTLDTRAPSAGCGC